MISFFLPFTRYADQFKDFAGVKEDTFNEKVFTATVIK